MTKFKLFAVAAMVAGTSTLAIAQEAGSNSGGGNGVDMYETFQGPHPGRGFIGDIDRPFEGRNAGVQGGAYGYGAGAVVVDEAIEPVEALPRRSRMMNETTRAPVTRR